MNQQDKHNATVSWAAKGGDSKFLERLERVENAAPHAAETFFNEELPAGQKQLEKFRTERNDEAAGQLEKALNEKKRRMTPLFGAGISKPKEASEQPYSKEREIFHSLIVFFKQEYPESMAQSAKFREGNMSEAADQLEKAVGEKKRLMLSRLQSLEEDLAQLGIA